MQVRDWFLVIAVCAGVMGTASSYNAGYERGIAVGKNDSNEAYHLGQLLGEYRERTRWKEQSEREDIDWQVVKAQILQLQDRVDLLEKMGHDQ